MPASRRAHLALAGNAGALVLLVALLAVVRFGPTAGPYIDKPAFPEPQTPARRVLLVILDGLRADLAFDPLLMPRLNVLAAQGGRGRVRVESLLPATVSAVVTLAQGRVAPPLLALQDFGAATADSGGLFQVLHQTGRESFVAGTSLWEDRYGPWISATASNPHPRADDPPLLKAALSALQDLRYSFLLVHFNVGDDVAHLYGGRSVQYHLAALWADRALARLLARVGPETAVLVMADNGVADNGGHAGPEPAVLYPPLVTAGPGLPRGDLGIVPQRQVPELVLTALGMDPAALLVPEPPRPTVWDWLMVALIVPALGFAPRLWQAMAAGWSGGDRAFWLNATVWVALGLAWFSPLAAAALAVLVLGLAAGTYQGGGSGCSSVTSSRRPPGTAGSLPRSGGGLGRGCVFALSAGVAFFLPRLADGWLSLEGGFWGLALIATVTVLAMLAVQQMARRSWLLSLPKPPLPWTLGASALLIAAYPLGGWPLLLVTALALVGGGWLGTRAVSPTAALVVGITTLAVQTLLLRLLGETLSLSTLDVQAAFAVLDTPAGLPGAVLLTVARAALPGLALAAGLVLGFYRLSTSPVPAWSAGLAAALAGMGTAAALVFVLGRAEQVLVALALGGVLRTLAELCFLFLGMAGFLALVRDRWAARHPPLTTTTGCPSKADRRTEH